MNVAPSSILLDMSRDYHGYRDWRERSWYGYSDGDGWGAIPFSAPCLFRGQNHRYLPMMPSISRGLESSSTGELWKYSIPDQAKIILRLAQSWWFSRELDYHPITAHAANQRLSFDRLALAQHYGIPTGYLDLTDDFNVSAFFATCRETKYGWEPVGEDDVGVIYRVALKKLENPFGRYMPLGPQILPRPTEQCAWVAELPLRHSFEGWPDVSILHFRHDKSVGEYFLSMFDGGRLLFPDDPLAEVAAEILACQEIPGEILEGSMQAFVDADFGVVKEHIQPIRDELLRITKWTGYRRLLKDEQVSKLLNDVSWKDRVLSRVKANWRAVREVNPHDRKDSE